MHLYGRLPGDWGAHQSPKVVSRSRRQNDGSSPNNSVVFIVRGPHHRT